MVNYCLLGAIILLQLVSLGVTLMNAADVLALLDKLKTDVSAKLADLKAQIAALVAGEPVTQPQLDAIGAGLQAIDDSLTAGDVPPAV